MTPRCSFHKKVASTAFYGFIAEHSSARKLLLSYPRAAVHNSDRYDQIHNHSLYADVNHISWKGLIID